MDNRYQNAEIDVNESVLVEGMNQGPCAAHARCDSLSIRLSLIAYRNLWFDLTAPTVLALLASCFLRLKTINGNQAFVARSAYYQRPSRHGLWPSRLDNLGLRVLSKRFGRTPRPPRADRESVARHNRSF